jgi:glycosyltransferase involved in cell wall biosynthesis
MAIGEQTPLVSVIVPVRNGGEQLGLLLDALARQTADPDLYEVLVADDCSTDDTPERAAACPVARLIPASTSGGSYAARNRGLAEARGTLLAFTDADCLPGRDWIERGIQALEPDDVDLAAGRVEMPLGTRPSAAALIDFVRHLDQERAVGDGFGATANLWVKRRVFEQVGRFNDRLISGGDTEFGHRALAAGARLVYRPDLRVVHPARSRPRELARKAFRLGFGAAQQRVHAAGVLRERPRIYLHPGAYRPRLRMSGKDRLRRHGVRLRPGLRVSMPMVEYFFVRLPIVAGNFRGARHEARARGAP